MARKRRKISWLMWWLLGAIATAAIGAGVSYYNMGQQAKFNDQNIDFVNWQNQRNIDNQWQMWDATNEYNKPVNQMKRFEEAGLNPNLIYGQTNTANPITLPSQATPQGQSAPQFDASFLLDQLQKLPFFREQLESVKLDNEAKRLQNNILSEQGMQASFETGIKSFEFSRVNAILQDSEKFSAVVDSWFEKQILETESIKKKNALLDAQKVFQERSSELKQLEYEFNTKTGRFEEAEFGYYELKLEALRIANELADIDLDWALGEKTLGASSEFSRILFNLVRMFTGKNK